MPEEKARSRVGILLLDGGERGERWSATREAPKNLLVGVVWRRRAMEEGKRVMQTYHTRRREKVKMQRKGDKHDGEEEIRREKTQIGKKQVLLWDGRKACSTGCNSRKQWCISPISFSCRRSLLFNIYPFHTDNGQSLNCNSQGPFLSTISAEKTSSRIRFLILA